MNGTEGVQAMQRRLAESAARGDVHALKELITRDADSARRAASSALHLAARFGHLGYAAEVVGTWPEVAAEENAELETPLHEACREGHLEIAELLLEADPWIAYRVNSRNESALFAAVERGQLHVVRHLIFNFSGLLMLDLDTELTSLHVAASFGNTGSFSFFLFFFNK